MERKCKGLRAARRTGGSRLIHLEPRLAKLLEVGPEIAAHAAAHVLGHGVPVALREELVLGELVHAVECGALERLARARKDAPLDGGGARHGVTSKSDGREGGWGVRVMEKAGMGWQGRGGHTRGCFKSAGPTWTAASCAMPKRSTMRRVVVALMSRVSRAMPAE